MTTLTRKLTVEFIGTFFLVLTVGVAVATAGNLAPLAIGSILMVMVFAGGHISGAHYNPAVSTAVLLRGKMAAGEYGPYVLTQLVAGVLAGLTVRALGYAPAAHAAVAGTGKMLVAEFLFTFALAYVVLHVATSNDTEGNSFFGLAIGFTLATAAFTIGPLSGGAINPAVALGASVVGMFAWSHIWIYLLAELVGGVIAAGAFLLTQGERPTALVRPAQSGGEARRRDGSAAPRSVSPRAT